MKQKIIRSLEFLGNQVLRFEGDKHNNISNQEETKKIANNLLQTGLISKNYSKAEALEKL